MKKLSLVLLGALAVAQAAQAAPCSFTGFYVGGQLGWTGRSDKTNASANGSSNGKTNTSGLTYGLYTGYGQNNSGLYWGGEFSIEADTASKRNNYAFNFSGISGASNSKYSRGVVVGITPRLGGVFSCDNLVYVKLGLEFSRDKAEISAQGAQGANSFSYAASKSQNKLAFVPGIGYERAFSPHLLGRIEYAYNFGNKINLPAINASGVTVTSNVKYTANVVKVGLHYKF